MNTLSILLAWWIGIFIPIHALGQQSHQIEHRTHLSAQLHRDSSILGGNPRTIVALEDTHFKQAPRVPSDSWGISSRTTLALEDAHLRVQPPSAEIASSLHPLLSDFIVLGNAWPNPARGDSVITFALSEPKTLAMDLVNAAGQQVAWIADGKFAAGNHSVTVDTDRLAAGVYYYHLRTDGQVLSKKLVVVSRISLIGFLQRGSAMRRPFPPFAPRREPLPRSVGLTFFKDRMVMNRIPSHSSTGILLPTWIRKNPPGFIRDTSQVSSPCSHWLRWPSFSISRSEPWAASHLQEREAKEDEMTAESENLKGSAGELAVAMNAEGQVVWQQGRTRRGHCLGGGSLTSPCCIYLFHVIGNTF
jgi:hypothetical protein